MIGQIPDIPRKKDGIAMTTITLKQNIPSNVTILSNDFIDHYMCRADGEYVKIYLLIERRTGADLPVQIDDLADTLELTHKDVLRALKYWEKEGLLDLGTEEAPAAPTEAPLSSAQTSSSAPSPSNPAWTDPSVSVPAKGTRSASDMEKAMQGTDLEQTVFMAETYIGRPLSVSELNSFCYISDDLHFPSALLDYLIEYCITRGKKSVRYMESVAIRWFQQGIDSVEKAKEQTALYTKNVFPVMKAFGIAGRNPGPSELDYIQKWNSLGFDTDIIVEACNRTLLATHQASFAYASRILEDWKKAGVRNTADIQILDKKHHSKAKSQVDNYPNNQPAPAARKKSSPNAFHNFDQRSYDYDDLASRLADKNRRQP